MHYIVSLARPSLKERGSGQTATVELYIPMKFSHPHNYFGCDKWVLSRARSSCVRARTRAYACRSESWWTELLVVLTNVY